MIRQALPDHDTAIIDVGGGAARLVDGLLLAGYHRLTIVDLSAAALAHSRTRLAGAGASVVWREADVLTTELGRGAFDLWYDGAVFPFLTDAADRATYVAQVRRALRPGGYLLVATFAEDGPTRCSGLDVAHYTPADLHAEFGTAFRVVESRHQVHHAPWGAPQAFTYCLCRYDG